MSKGFPNGRRGASKPLTIHDVITWINDHYHIAKDKGDWWKKATVWYLKNDPEMRQLMDDVHLGNTAITNNDKDTGIDIVARNLYSPQEKNTAEGTFWAIQCKNWDYELRYGNIATFIASTAIDSRYSGFILSTVGSYSEEINNKFDELNHQNNKSALIITPESMEKHHLIGMISFMIGLLIKYI